MSESSPKRPPRPGQRVPSGPRPPISRQSTTSASNLLSLIQGYEAPDETASWVPSTSQGLTTSPTSSPPISTGLVNPFDRPLAPQPQTSTSGTNLSSVPQGTTDPTRHVRKQNSVPILLSIKPKPKPLKVNTANLIPPQTSPKKAPSPSLEHWQQVRSHVLSTPLEAKEKEKSKAQTQGTWARAGLVGKAAAKLGFKHVVEATTSTGTARQAIQGQTSGLSQLEKDEIAKERRMFARDIRDCLDACALEESKRRLAGPRSSRERGTNPRDHSQPPSATPAQSQFHPDFSPFAPLITELHKYLPAARAKQAWARNCPHHTTILTELSTAFLPGGLSTSGERQQALEVFGVMVRSWASDGTEEELSRWVWLLRALRFGDRQLRNRGLTLLSSFLHRDPGLPTDGNPPDSFEAFQAVAKGLLELLSAVEGSEYDISDHRRIVLGLLVDLAEGNVVSVKGSEGSSGMAKEYLWLAFGRLVRSPSMLEWILAPNNPILFKFAPPPILHATPPGVLDLRQQSAITFLTSLASAIPYLSPPVIQQVFSLAQDMILNDLARLPQDQGSAIAFGGLLLACLVYCEPSNSLQKEDPFMSRASVDQNYLDAINQLVNTGSEGTKGLEVALEQLIRVTELRRVRYLLQSLAAEKALKPLCSSGVQAVLKRIELSPSTQDALDLLLDLSRSHPQQYYKPLFSLAASSKPSTASTLLESVRTISDLVGSSTFWLEADPQMVVVVLMGDAKQGQSNGKRTQGEMEAVNVKIGRYAVLVEFLRALDEVKGGAKSGSRLRGFLESVEARLSLILASKNDELQWPEAYQALLCVLFYRIRSITQSTKKAEWQSVILKWFHTATQVDQTQLSLSELQQIYRSIATPSAHSSIAKQRSSTMMTDITQSHPPILPSDPLYPLLHPHLHQSCAELLVLVQSCWTTDQWESILPVAWNRLDSTNLISLLFLLQTCAEKIPAQLRPVIESDLQNPSPIIRTSAINKLATLYSYRYQITSQPTLHHRRGPLFYFPQETLDFVFTEIGSPVWSAPHDVKQEALQKYGSNLPVEVRQRLMELGWSDEPGVKVDEGYLAEPISSFPTRHLLDSEDNTKGLKRQNSTGSGSESGAGIKAPKAIFSPMLWEIIAFQAIQSPKEDGGGSSLSSDLLRMLQRDDPILLIRPFAGHMSIDFKSSLARLNAATVKPTPAFAYTAFNAVVGYLKHTLRISSRIDGYAQALTTIASLIAHVPDISLREIRKHKAEHILLPASIYEEEGGFKVHAPWRDGEVETQAAQLLVMAEILKVNPREGGVVKRMMSNLHLQESSLLDLTFGRAWLNLIVTLFGLVNRTYNDRAELRSFLTTATTILRAHQSDLLIVSRSIRLFMLCSARFRRLFAIMGFQTIMKPIFDTYVNGSSAIRDGIEYAMRSFYRIHQDSFVYQTCLAISFTSEAGAVYSLLSALSVPNGISSGVSSGLKGLNDKEEQDALVQMLSGPEITLSELGKDRAERQAVKLAQAALSENRLFARENIIKLFVTVIAANPPNHSGINMLKLFSGMVEYIKDESSRKLLGDGVEALGGIISKEKVDPVSAGGILGDDTGLVDWNEAKVGYLLLVDKWLKSDEILSQQCTKTVLEIISEVVDNQIEEGYRPASNILLSLTTIHLASDRPQAYHKIAATTFQATLGVLDLSPVLDGFRGWIKKNEYEVDNGMAHLMVDGYLRPSIMHVLNGQKSGEVDNESIRQSTVSLLSAAIFIQGGALDILEDVPISLPFLAYMILPLVLSLKGPTGIDHDKSASGMWIRLLHFIINPKSAISTSSNPRSSALIQVLSLQIVKVICIRAPNTISSVRGLWGYLANYIIGLITNRPGVSESEVGVGDMMAWSMYELLALHRSPLMIHLRHHIQLSLAAQSDDPNPNPSNPMPKGARTPSINFRTPTKSNYPRFTPSPQPGNLPCLTTSLSLTSTSGSLDRSGIRRPTFSELSIRRSSRPSLAPLPLGKPTGTGGARFRFPSSAETRKVRRGEAIVHILGPSTRIDAGMKDEHKENETEVGWNNVLLSSTEWVDRIERSKKACRVIFGYPVEEVEGDSIRSWSVHDALMEIAEEARLLVEVEFPDLFKHGLAGSSVGSAENAVELGSGYEEFGDKGIMEGSDHDEDEEPLLVHP